MRYLFEIQGGEGGNDSKDFADKMASMYRKYVGEHNIQEIDSGKFLISDEIT